MSNRTVAWPVISSHIRARVRQRKTVLEFLCHFGGSLDHRFGQSSQSSNIHAIALGAGARGELVEEGDVLGGWIHDTCLCHSTHHETGLLIYVRRQVNTAHINYHVEHGDESIASKLLHQHMVVRGEEGQAADLCVGITV